MTTKRAARSEGAKPVPGVDSVLDWLRKKGTKRNVDGLLRYGITAKQAFGVSVGELQKFAKTIGKDHGLARALWASRWYEARMLATLVDEPAAVTPRQMDSWAKAFDNWAICDTACFHLFDRTPHAYAKAPEWCEAQPEFVRRAGFALMASLAGHDRTAPDAPFRAFLVLIEKGAGDERNFVKKAVNWALRRIGERSTALHDAAIEVACRLAASPDPTPRWIGKDALRALRSPVVRARLARKNR